LHIFTVTVSDDTYSLVVGGNQCSVFLYPLPPQSQAYVIDYRLMHRNKIPKLSDRWDDSSYYWRHCPRDCAVLVQHTA
jgi:hypothetical protein